MKFPFTLLITFLFFLTHCSQLPKKKLSQFSLQEIGYEVTNDSLIIHFSNPLHCPLRISVKSADPIIQEKLDDNFPVVIDPQQDTVLTYWTDQSKDEISIRFSATMGNPNAPIHKKALNLPFRKGKKYKIIQGYNGSFSHTSEYSKYALDFSLQEGDTICAAADGFVVGVIEGYSRSGKSKKWRDYANYITVFHPEMNLFTQYVHLMPNGSLVEVGDSVTSGQAMGLSGKTGQTDVEHLHFNVLQPNPSGMESTQIEFLEGYQGVKLKRGDWVEK
jgi:murein DD-endopeptidase MepM/ murein hydrolase activator NlpD